MSEVFDYRNLAYDGPERRLHQRRQSNEYSQSIRLNPLVRDRRKSSGRRKDEQVRWPGFEI